MNNPEQYQQFAKPSWAPSPKVFGPVWTMLYILIAISYITVLKMFFAGSISFFVLLPFLLNLFFNIWYTPLQFRFRNMTLATIDILLVDATLIWALITIFTHASWVSYINIPYLLWSLFATVLQITIYRMNN